MITRLYLHNAQKFQGKVIDLGPFTILSGPPESGKTTIVRAIQTCVSDHVTDTLLRPSVAKANRIEVLAAAGSKYHVEAEHDDGTRSGYVSGKQSGPKVALLLEALKRTLCSDSDISASFFAKALPEVEQGWFAGVAAPLRARLAALESAPLSMAISTAQGKIASAQAVLARAPVGGRSAEEVERLRAAAADEAEVALAAWDAWRDAAAAVKQAAASHATHHAWQERVRKAREALAALPPDDDAAFAVVAVPAIAEMIRQERLCVCQRSMRGEYAQAMLDYYTGVAEDAAPAVALRRVASEPEPAVFDASPAEQALAAQPEYPLCEAWTSAQARATSLREELAAARNGATPDQLAQAKLDEAAWTTVLDTLVELRSQRFAKAKEAFGVRVSAAMGPRSDGKPFRVGFLARRDLFAAGLLSPTGEWEHASGFTELRLLTALALATCPASGTCPHSGGLILPDDRQSTVEDFTRWAVAAAVAVRALRERGVDVQVVVQTTLALPRELTDCTIVRL